LEELLFSQETEVIPRIAERLRNDLGPGV